MNVTQIDICNSALGRLGDSSAIASLGEGSVQADVLARVYTPALEKTLEAAPWPFATKRALLAATSPELTLYPEWGYQYAWPADCVRALKIEDNSRAETSEHVIPFRIESKVDGSARVILTDQPAAVLQYVQRVTSVAAFPAMFVDAFTWALADEACMALTKDERKQQTCQLQWVLAVNKAFATESNQRQTDPPTEAEWIRARG